MIMANNNENKILNVPNLRFPEFSGEWVTKSINDLAVVIGGGTPDTTVKSYWDGEIQWFTPSEIGKNKYVDSSLRTITEVGLNNSSAKLLPPQYDTFFKFSCHHWRMLIISQRMCYKPRFSMSCI